MRFTRHSIALLMALAASAPAAEAATPSYYVTVQGGDAAWSRGRCAHLHNVVTLSRQDSATVECASGASAPSDRSRYAYHFHSERQPDGALRLRVENWSRRAGDEADFEAADWRVAPGPESEQRL